MATPTLVETTTSTPLSTTTGLNGISDMARTLFSTENVTSVGQLVGGKVSELRRQAEDGHHSLQLLALLGGVILMVVASMGFIANMVALDIVGALIEVYSFAIGAVITILESRNMILSESFQVRIFKYALFLKFLWGRGCMYFLVGTLQLYHLNLWNLCAGGYMCSIGALMVVVGQRTAYKLKRIRKSLYSAHELQTKFAESDLAGDGALDAQQFRMLTLSLDLDMTRREAEAAFNHIKKTNSEKLSYDEFLSWWTNTEMEDNIVENAFSFV